MDKNPWFRTLVIMLVFIAALYLGGLLYQIASRFGEIILLFFLAWLLAFALGPIARILVRWGMSRLAAALLIYVGFLLFAILLAIMVVPSTASQLQQLGQNLPAYVQTAPETVSQLQSWLEDRGIQGLDLSSAYKDQNLINRAESIGTLLAQNALTIAQGAASLIFSLVIILILSFYFMMDTDRISTSFLHFLPDRYEKEAVFFLDSIEKSFGGFIRGIMIQAAVYGSGTAVVMGIAGLNYVALASAFAGAIMVIPFFGTFLAIIPPIVLAALTLSWGKVLFVAIALLVLQQIVLNVLSPKVMGDSVGMHPLLVFLAMLIGLREAGIWGAIFGVPIMAVIYSMALYIHNRVYPARQLGRKPAVNEYAPALSARLDES